MTHYFDIGPEQFTCQLTNIYTNRYLWYSGDYNHDTLFHIDSGKGFRTKEACENYIRTRVKITCKQLLKG